MLKLVDQINVLPDDSKDRMTYQLAFWSLTDGLTMKAYFEDSALIGLFNELVDTQKSSVAKKLLTADEYAIALEDDFDRTNPDYTALAKAITKDTGKLKTRLEAYYGKAKFNQLFTEALDEQADEVADLARKINNILGSVSK